MHTTPHTTDHQRLGRMASVMERRADAGHATTDADLYRAGFSAAECARLGGAAREEANRRLAAKGRDEHYVADLVA